MSKFSPGPWEWDLCDGGGFALLNSKGKVAYADRTGVDVVVTSPADARLIAAAPEMYDLLTFVFREGKLGVDEIMAAVRKWIALRARIDAGEALP